MRYRIAFAGNGLGKTAFQLFAGREPHGVHENVQPVPGLAEILEHGVDFLIRGHVAGKQQVGVLLEACRELLDPALELVILCR